MKELSNYIFEGFFSNVGITPYLEKIKRYKESKHLRITDLAIWTVMTSLYTANLINKEDAYDYFTNGKPNQAPYSFNVGTLHNSHRYGEKPSLRIYPIQPNVKGYSNIESRVKDILDYLELGYKEGDAAEGREHKGLPRHHYIEIII